MDAGCRELLRCPGEFHWEMEEFWQKSPNGCLAYQSILAKMFTKKKICSISCLSFRWPKIATAISQCADIEFLAPGTKECNHGCNHLSPRLTWPVYSYKLNITTPPYMRASFGKQ